MKYAVLVRTLDVRHNMIGSSHYAIQTFVYPSNLDENTVPVECISLDGLPFSAIELR